MIHILSEFIEGPWGGGNQFQKALRENLILKGKYSEDINKADVIIVNSHHWNNRLWELFKLKRTNANVTIIHRVDGPVFIVRGSREQILVDKTIIYFNRYIADGTIFQSDWSKKQCISIGMDDKKKQITIMNAPNPNIFYPAKKPLEYKKIRLIATSWSGNMQKGFDVYQYLDNNLDFSKYEFTFIGNSPIKFNNIKHIQPLPSKELANRLREHDLFITASVNDPCSNSLIEAMHCGLVPIVRNSGGHPEIINNSGVLFNGEEDVLNKIKLAGKNKKSLRQSFDLMTIDSIVEKYIKFSKSFIEKKINNPKKPSYYNYYKIFLSSKIFNKASYLSRITLKIIKY